jgi:hypothetical protein
MSKEIDNLLNEVQEPESQETSEQVRSPRASEDREVHQRVESWENPSNLPNPDPQPGWVFRYIRTAILNYIFI